MQKIHSFKRSSFEKSLLLIGRDPESFAESFYQNVLAADSEFEQIFRNTDLKFQKSELIKGLLMIFSLMEDGETFNSFLRDLGARHICYEVRPNHYPMIETALLDALKVLHGDYWKGELIEQWQRLIGHIANEMQKGGEAILAA
jgi:hemoglobin-like flavoprotein